MKTISVLLFLALLAGCSSSPPIEELMEEASQCVREYSENGDVVMTPAEHSTECWKEVNRETDRIDKRRARRLAEEIELETRKAGAKVCRDAGLAQACDHWGRCNCINLRDLRW